jgi:hypothetical protein
MIKMPKKYFSQKRINYQDHLRGAEKIYVSKGGTLATKTKRIGKGGKVKTRYHYFPINKPNIDKVEKHTSRYKDSSSFIRKLRNHK